MKKLVSALPALRLLKFLSHLGCIYLHLSRQTHSVLMQNITLALSIKAVFFVLSVFGSATMWMAVFADMGASLLVVGNGLRLLRKQRLRSEALGPRLRPR